MFWVNKYFKKVVNLCKQLNEFETNVYKIEEDTINLKKV